MALAQLPRTRRRQTLIRTDSGGGTHEFLTWLTRPGRWLKYSIGFTVTDDIGEAILRLPAGAWTPAYDAEGQVRPGAWIAEITGLANLTSRPKGMRVIVRRERPHPGARLRFTCFVTNTKQGQLADLKLRHRRRRAPGPRRPTTPAPHRRPMALGHADHHRRHTSASPAGVTLTSAKPLHRTGKDIHGPVEPRSPGATAGPPR